MITIQTRHARFKKIPFFSISRWVTKPEPKTMAFGGVPTGIMNEHDEARAIGITRLTGVNPSSEETE
jgi:hypothetical protein